LTASESAIHANGARAELLQVHGGADGAANQALDLGGATVEFAFGDVARFAAQGGVREHGIFRREPAAFDLLFLHPARDGFLNGDRADDPGVAPLDQGGTGRMRRDMILEAQGAQLATGAPIGANDVGHGDRLQGSGVMVN